MSKGWWFRFILTGFIVLMSVYTVLPTFLPERPVESQKKEGEEAKKVREPWYYKILPSHRMKLGLDLKGGLSLTLGVDTNKALETEANVYVEDLKRFLPKEGIELEGAERVAKSSRIRVTLEDPKKRSKLLSYVKTKFGVLEFVEEDAGSLVFDITAEKKKEIRRFTIEQMLEQQRNRIDEYGVAEPSIQPLGSERILIQLPGEKDSERAQSVIRRVANLEFKHVEKSKTSEELESMIAEAIGSGKLKEKYLPEEVNRVLQDKLPPATQVLWEDRVDSSTGESVREFFLLRENPILTGKYLEDARVGYDRLNKPEVDLAFNAGGAEIFANYTKENVGEKLAIILDDHVNSAPKIQDPILNGRARITLGGVRTRDEMRKEAQDLVVVLRAGALPAPVEILETRVVGPSLGKDSIEKGAKSVLAGVLIVIVFVLFYYGIGGVFADVALALNLLFIMAMMIAMDATLTLPGIAGMALSMGMAIDANVIINERIREEIRSGKPLRNAVSIGFKRSLLTILDANLTTLIAAFVLLQYGTGPVKGFAVTLMVGLVISFYTAFMIVKMLFELYLAKSKSEKMYI